MNSCGKPPVTASEGKRLLSLLREAGVDNRRIDRGVPRIDFSRSPYRMETAAGTANNKVLESGEIFAAAIRLLEKEEDAFAASGGTTDRPFTQLVSRKSSFRWPVLFSDFKGNTRQDDAALIALSDELKRMRREICGNARNPSAALKRRFLGRIVEWMRGRVERTDYQSHEKTNREMLAGARGDCTELARFAYGVLRLAGFRPRFIMMYNTPETSVKGAPGSSGIFHQMVAVDDPSGSGRPVFIDLYHDGVVNEPQQPWVGMPAAAAMAVYYMNKAAAKAEQRDAITRFVMYNGYRYNRNFMGRAALKALVKAADAIVCGAEGLYRRALGYAPDLPMTMFNYANLLASATTRFDEAEGLAHQALRLMPTFREVHGLRAFIELKRALFISRPEDDSEDIVR